MWNLQEPQATEDCVQQNPSLSYCRVWEGAAGYCQVRLENSVLQEELTGLHIRATTLKLTKEPSPGQKKYWESVKFSNNVFKAHYDADIYLLNNVACVSILKFAW